MGLVYVMKESVIETPLIGSGSMEEAVNRVNALLELGTSRGYLTYEELNEKLPDEVVSPDKLDSLLMKIDEMGIKLIDETDVESFESRPRSRPRRIVLPPASLRDIAGYEMPSKDGSARDVIKGLTGP